MWFKPKYDNSNQSICYFNNIILANKVCLYPKESNTNEIDIRVAFIAWDSIEYISIHDISIDDISIDDIIIDDIIN